MGSARRAKLSFSSFSKTNSILRKAAMTIFPAWTTKNLAGCDAGRAPVVEFELAIHKNILRHLDQAGKFAAGSVLFHPGLVRLRSPHVYLEPAVLILGLWIRCYALSQGRGVSPFLKTPFVEVVESRYTAPA
jgi:hypothetical protein